MFWPGLLIEEEQQLPNQFQISFHVPFLAFMLHIAQQVMVVGPIPNPAWHSTAGFQLRASTGSDSERGVKISHTGARRVPRAAGWLRLRASRLSPDSMKERVNRFSWMETA